MVATLPGGIKVPLTQAQNNALRGALFQMLDQEIENDDPSVSFYPVIYYAHRTEHKNIRQRQALVEALEAKGLVTLGADGVAPLTETGKQVAIVQINRQFTRQWDEFSVEYVAQGKKNNAEEEQREREFAVASGLVARYAESLGVEIRDAGYRTARVSLKDLAALLRCAADDAALFAAYRKGN